MSDRHPVFPSVFFLTAHSVISFSSSLFFPERDAYLQLYPDISRTVSSWYITFPYKLRSVNMLEENIVVPSPIRFSLTAAGTIEATVFSLH